MNALLSYDESAGTENMRPGLSSNEGITTSLFCPQAPVNLF